jgi:hypothetical protein
MGPEHADQIAPLGAIFAAVYREVRPARLLLLGSATGNGLEHVDAAVTSRAVAIDINPAFVAATRARHARLGSALDVRCADVCSCDLGAEPFDLVHAALIFEHVAAQPLADRIATWTAPGGTCAVVVQAGGGQAPVTPSRFASIAALGPGMRRVSPAEVADLLVRRGFCAVRAWPVTAKGEKRLDVALFQRHGPVSQKVARARNPGQG